VEADSLFMTNGSSQGLQMVLDLFTSEGDTIFVEHPTYFHALTMFRVMTPASPLLFALRSSPSRLPSPHKAHTKPGPRIERGGCEDGRRRYRRGRSRIQVTCARPTQQEMKQVRVSTTM
jgi:hypothetical protein